jgi:cytochrome P450
MIHARRVRTLLRFLKDIFKLLYKELLYKNHVGQYRLYMRGDDLLKATLDDGTYFSNPFPLFAQLREHDPIFYSEHLGGWVVTRYDDVAEILHNHQDYSSKGRVLHLISQLDGDVRDQLPLLQMHFATGLAHSDAPEHKRLRSLLAQAFTPKISENMRPITKSIVGDVLDQLDSEADLIADLFTPVPALVVGQLLGSRVEDIPNLIRWAHAINGLYEKGGKIDGAKAIHAEEMLGQMREFVRERADERRSALQRGSLDPESDVLAGLVSAESEDGALSDSELLSTMVTLFVAGHETTTHLLGNGLLAILHQRSLFEEICADPNLIPKAIDEMARFDGSVPRSWRIAKQEMRIGDITIPQGALVLPILASANRDEKVFDNPDRFDLQRDSRKHLAFGKGVHVCLGAPLARIEGQEIITEIVKRFPNIALNTEYEKLQWRRDFALRGLIELPVTL